MKKNENILRMMSGLDEKYIEEAEKMSVYPQKAIWKRVSAIAASVALVAAICAFPIWGNFGSHEIGSAIGTQDLAEKEIVWDAQAGVFVLKYRADDSGAETGFAAEGATETVTGNAITGVGIGIPSEEIKATPNILYPYMTGEYEEYDITKGKVTADKIGEKLGDVIMMGDDGETLKAEAYAIEVVDTKCAVAVKYPKYASYCIFRNANVMFSSFAEFKAAYSLETELYMGVVMVEHIVADNSDRLVEFSSIAPLKAMILALDGESCTYEEFAKNCDMKKSIGLEATQGAFWGFVSGGLQIFEDGYLVTNLDGGLRIFKIGKSDAKAIIADAKAHSYMGVNFYDESRDVFVDETKKDDYTGALPETEISGPYIPSSGDDPYELVTPSYDPHKPQSEQTEIAWETEIYVVPEIYSTESDLHETNPLIYEGKDPYAWAETTTAAPPYMPETAVSGAYPTNPLVYDPYGYLDGIPD